MAQQKTEVPTYLNVGKILTYAMYAYVMFGIIVLGLRVFLLAFSASPDAGFVEFIYKTSSDFLQPFRGIFPPRAVSETGYLDVSAMFAMIIYGMIAMGFSSLIGYIQSKIDQYNQ
ncbi:MAG TPA: YggT family protein [Candidatus Saccharibacteria bacterium]|nr:YggT family protein [Candidatus Saccharibacteria bacterium]